MFVEDEVTGIHPVYSQKYERRLNVEQPTPEESSESFSEGYKKAYDELISNGMNPRKARRFLDSVAKRKFKKVLKTMKKNGRTNSISIPVDNEQDVCLNEQIN